jgi:hypothetical protein
LDYIVDNQYPDFANYVLGSLILVNIETTDVMLGLPGIPQSYVQEVSASLDPGLILDGVLDAPTNTITIRMGSSLCENESV